METYNVLFYAKKVKNNPKASTIYLRITVSGKRTEISTGQTINTSQWGIKSGKVAGNTPNAKQLNALLEGIRSKIFECYTALFNTGKEITCESLRNKYLKIEERKVTLIETFKDHNSKMKELIGKEFSKGTWERYETSLRHTQSFLKWKFNLSDINVCDVNPAFVADYEFYLRTVRNCSNNSAVKYIKNFGKIIRICLANKWLKYDPFISYNSKFIVVDRSFLDEDEIQKLSEKNLEIERISQVRDIFLFSCYTGLAYIDTKNLKHSNIGVGIDGNKWIFTSRQKTKSLSNIPLLPKAEEIIEKYKNHPYCKITGSLLPVLSNQKMNAYLKEIADLCGINKELTFHIARHTFATTVTLSNGVPIESVSKMLGHKNIKTTQHYAKILDSKVSNDMNILKEKLAQKELKMKIS